MSDLWSQIAKLTRALPDFIVWKIDSFANDLAATKAFDSQAHRDARARERESFDRLMEKLN